MSARAAGWAIATAALIVVVAGTWAAAYFTVPDTRAVQRTAGTPVIDDAAAIGTATNLINAVFALPVTDNPANIGAFKASTCDDYRHQNLQMLQQRLDQVRSSGEPTSAQVVAIGVVPHAATASTAQVLAAVTAAHAGSELRYRVTYTVAVQQGRVCVSAADFQS